MPQIYKILVREHILCDDAALESEVRCLGQQQLGKRETKRVLQQPCGSTSFLRTVGLVWPCRNALNAAPQREWADQQTNKVHQPCLPRALSEPPHNSSATPVAHVREASHTGATAQARLVQE